MLPRLLDILKAEVVARGAILVILLELETPLCEGERPAANKKNYLSKQRSRF